jgi:uncharacterized protein (DUF697 family)/tellurite resistance protein
MQTTEQQALLTISILAAFADGAKDDTERQQIRSVAESLAGESLAADLPRLYQDVLLKRVDVTQAAAALPDPAHRQLAYEMAVCVCDADGAASPAERQFLGDLKQALGLADAQTATVEREAGAIAALPLQTTPTPAAAAKVSDAELDQSILNASILNGALELLPQSWASMAIIPLQMKLIYRIGQAHGYELDKGHAKEFIAAAGVGLAGQYLEQFGRKLLGGLLGKAAGGLGRSLGGAATGIAMSFATTYALGQLAKRYYASRRQISSGVLRETYESLLGPAKQLQTQYLPQIQQRAGSIDSAQIMSMVKNA